MLQTVARTHFLKTHPQNFEAVISGAKKAEVRDNTDRNFKVGEKLRLMEWVCDETLTGGFRRLLQDPYYTGRECMVIIDHIQSGYGLPINLVVLSITRL